MLKVRVIENTADFRPRPRTIPGYHRFSNGMLDVFVHKKDVLERIADWARQWGDAEIAGRLVGRVYRDDRDFWCVVTGAILADFESGPITVKTTDVDAAFTVRAMQEDHPAEDLMGWFHDHTGGLKDYSNVDRNNQKQWTKPYHLGLLAIRHRRGVTMRTYRGPESEPFSGRYTARDDDRASNAVVQAQGMPMAVMADASHTPQSDRRSDHWLRDVLFVLSWPIALVVAIYLMLEVMDQRTEPVTVQLRRMDEVVEAIRSESQVKTLRLEQQLARLQQQRASESSSASSWVHWLSELATSQTADETSDAAVSSVNTVEQATEEPTR